MDLLLFIIIPRLKTKVLGRTRTCNLHVTKQDWAGSADNRRKAATSSGETFHVVSMSLNPFAVTDLRPEVELVHLLRMRRRYCHVWNRQHWTDSEFAWTLCSLLYLFIYFINTENTEYRQVRSRDNNDRLRKGRDNLRHLPEYKNTKVPNATNVYPISLFPSYRGVSIVTLSLLTWGASIVNFLFRGKALNSGLRNFASK